MIVMAIYIICNNFISYQRPYLLSVQYLQPPDLKGWAKLLLFFLLLLSN